MSITRAVEEHLENWIPETLICAPGGELNQMAVDEEVADGCMHLSCTKGPPEMSMSAPVKMT